jgi:hypothetical protein
MESIEKGYLPRGCNLQMAHWGLDQVCTAEKGELDEAG